MRKTVTQKSIEELKRVSSNAIGEQARNFFTYTRKNMRFRQVFHLYVKFPIAGTSFRFAHKISSFFRQKPKFFMVKS